MLQVNRNPVPVTPARIESSKRELGLKVFAKFLCKRHPPLTATKHSDRTYALRTYVEISEAI